MCQLLYIVLYITKYAYEGTFSVSKLLLGINLLNFPCSSLFCDTVLGCMFFRCDSELLQKQQVILLKCIYTLISSCKFCNLLELPDCKLLFEYYGTFLGHE